VPERRVCFEFGRWEQDVIDGRFDEFDGIQHSQRPFNHPISEHKTPRALIMAPETVPSQPSAVESTSRPSRQVCLYGLSILGPALANLTTSTTTIDVVASPAGGPGQCRLGD
jgi:hypothetical protein